MDEQQVVDELQKELKKLLRSKDFTSLTPKHQKIALSNAIVSIKQTIRIYNL